MFALLFPGLKQVTVCKPLVETTGRRRTSSCVRFTVSLEKTVEISCANINEVNYHFTAYLPELTVLLISFLVIRLSLSGLLC